MSGINKVICIAGTNACAIEALKHLIKKKNKHIDIVALPDKGDKGKDGWQPSFRKFAIDNSINIVSLNQIYKIKNLFLFSLEYRDILKIDRFKSDMLYNIHFSLLPKFRGCHTNFLQILKGEKYSGVTLHKIDKGIDTGPIISQMKFVININDTGYQNYKKLMKYSFLIFKKNYLKILKNKIKSKKQNLKLGSYYSRKSVNYKKKIIIKNFKNNIRTHNKIRALIFPPFQLPIYNGKKIIKSSYKNKKIQLRYL